MATLSHEVCQPNQPGQIVSRSVRYGANTRQWRLTQESLLDKIYVVYVSIFVPLMTERILICWIGHTDLRAARGEKEAGAGPIGQAVAAREFDRVVLLSDHAKADAVA